MFFPQSQRFFRWLFSFLLSYKCLFFAVLSDSSCLTRTQLFVCRVFLCKHTHTQLYCHCKLSFICLLFSLCFFSFFLKHSSFLWLKMYTHTHLTVRQQLFCPNLFFPLFSKKIKFCCYPLFCSCTWFFQTWRCLSMPRSWMNNFIFHCQFKKSLHCLKSTSLDLFLW